MMICPNNKDDGFFVEACADRFRALFYGGTRMCASSLKFPPLSLTVIVEVLDTAGNYISHATYHRAAYHNQGEAFDRDNRIVILWRGWEFTQ